MKNISDEELEQSMNMFFTMKEVNAPNFFYTRLHTRMEHESNSNELTLPFKPIVVICILTLFVFINSFLLDKKSTLIIDNSNNYMEALAVSYDQTISN